MTMNQEKVQVDLSHNYHDLNRSKREKLVSSYYSMLVKSSETQDDQAALDCSKFRVERKIFADAYQDQAIKLDEF